MPRDPIAQGEAHIYEKIPVQIRAYQVTRERVEKMGDWPEWLQAALRLDAKEKGAMYLSLDGRFPFYINTEEGRHEVSFDDYVIQGVKGELYPCKPDIFELTYLPVRQGEQ